MLIHYGPLKLYSVKCRSAFTLGVATGWCCCCCIFNCLLFLMSLKCSIAAALPAIAVHDGSWWAGGCPPPASGFPRKRVEEQGVPEQNHTTLLLLAAAAAHRSGALKLLQAWWLCGSNQKQRVAIIQRTCLEDPSDLIPRNKQNNRNSRQYSQIQRVSVNFSKKLSEMWISVALCCNKFRLWTSGSLPLTWIKEGKIYSLRGFCRLFKVLCLIQLSATSHAFVPSLFLYVSGRVTWDKGQKRGDVRAERGRPDTYCFCTEGQLIRTKHSLCELPSHAETQNPSLLAAPWSCVCLQNDDCLHQTQEYSVKHSIFVLLDHYSFCSESLW